MSKKTKAILLTYIILSMICIGALVQILLPKINEYDVIYVSLISIFLFLTFKYTL